MGEGRTILRGFTALGTGILKSDLPSGRGIREELYRRHGMSPEWKLQGGERLEKESVSKK